MRPSTIPITSVFLLLVAACAGAPRGYRPTCDDWGDTGFFQSASRQLVRACLEAGAKVDALGDGGRTALHRAADARPALVPVLLEAGADVDARDEWGWTPLHLAVAGDQHASVAAALLEAGADVNLRDGRGRTPLHRAAQSGNLDVVRTLLEAGADIHATSGPGITPLHEAASGGTAEIVHALLAAGANVDAGADVTARDYSGYTPLHAAALWHPAVCPLLMRLGADPNTPDASGKTPWDHALRNPSLEGPAEVRRMREEMRRGWVER